MKLSTIPKFSTASLAILLAGPVTAAPRLMTRECLTQVSADAACGNSKIVSHCLAIVGSDSDLLSECLKDAGCSVEESKETVQAMDQCLAGGPLEVDESTEDDEELRRRDDTTTTTSSSSASTSASTSTSASSTSMSASTTDTATSTTATSSGTTTTASATAESTTSTSSSTSSATSTSASATSTSSSTKSVVNIKLSSIIVGSVMGLATTFSVGSIFFCCIRESVMKRRARKARDAKEALLGM